MRSSIAESTMTSTTVRAVHGTEAEFEFRRNVLENDSEDLQDCGRKVKRVTAKETELHWDPNIHPWFPVPSHDLIMK